ncbi:hypothetical protein GCM10027062_08560 [Nocardioides hungaricus]
MTGPRAVVAAVVAAVVLVLGLAACSGDPEPRVAPPSPTVPSTTGTSVQIPPQMPAVAKGTDAAAAEAFVRFYQDTVNYAQQTGDVKALRMLGLKCRGCDAGIEFITDVYEGGGTINGGDGRVAEFETGFVGEGYERAIVDCVVITTKQKVDLPGKGRDAVYPAGRQPIRFILDPSDEGWVVRSLGAQ